VKEWLAGNVSEDHGYLANASSAVEISHYSSKYDGLSLLDFRSEENSCNDHEFENILKSDIFPVSVADIGKRLANVFDKINNLKIEIDGENFNSSRRLRLGSTIEDIELNLKVALRRIEALEKIFIESNKKSSENATFLEQKHGISTSREDNYSIQNVSVDHLGDQIMSNGLIDEMFPVYPSDKLLLESDFKSFSSADHSCLDSDTDILQDSILDIRHQVKQKYDDDPDLY
jgi:hypothetical protein